MSRVIISILFLLLLGCHDASAQVILEKSIPRPHPIRQNDTVTVVIIGDVMMHSRQLEYDHHSFLQHISDSLKKADFCVINAEFPLGGEPYTGYPVFSTPDWYAEYLADCGADVFLMANNHVLDRGDRGLERTLVKYREMSGRIRFTGAGGNQQELQSVNPLMLRRRGFRIALVNFTYGTNMGSVSEWPKVQRMNREQLASSFKSAREQMADFIVALPHWGVEYELTHSAGQEEWAGWLAEQGACAIVGSHPHVVQDSSHVRGVPVIYSVGNAVSNMSARNTRLELAVKLSFVSDGSGNKHMLEPELKWMWCTLPGMLFPSYATIFVDEWKDRRDAWITKSDYDNMIETLARVQKATGIR